MYAYARAATPSSGAQRLFFVAGGDEAPDDEPVRDQREMLDTLRTAGFRGSMLRAYVVEDGKHNEAFWRREFPAAYLWLFAASEDRQDRSRLLSAPLKRPSGRSCSTGQTDTPLLASDETPK